ncbi:CAP domain-containing protein [Fodinicola feengrottensis]|nr:CAP domain-containing protein [Fodinicola feengrottensis]
MRTSRVFVALFLALGTTAVTTAVSVTPAQAATTGDYVNQVVTLTNQNRRAHGCPNLTLNATLTKVAQQHSADMAAHNYFSHNTQSGRATGRPDHRRRLPLAPLGGEHRGRLPDPGQGGVRLDGQHRPPGEHPELQPAGHRCRLRADHPRDLPDLLDAGLRHPLGRARRTRRGGSPVEFAYARTHADVRR